MYMSVCVCMCVCVGGWVGGWVGGLMGVRMCVCGGQGGEETVWQAWQPFLLSVSTFAVDFSSS